MTVRFNQNGFSLIELMFALTISAILIGIGYPTFIHHLIHVKRNRATIALLQLAGRLETYFSDNGSYQDATIGGLGAASLVDDLPYQLLIVSATDTHYEIQAVPQGAQAERDTRCGTLSLTDTNERKISGDGDIKQCWK
jgi:type IV pilus assembly protein PilE